MNKLKINEIDLFALIQYFWNYKKLIIIITAIITFLGIIYALIQTPLISPLFQYIHLRED